jgi:hypothetical protein
MSGVACGCDIDCKGGPYYCETHRLKVPVSGGAFVIKDSGQRETFAGGMVRDTAEGKTDYLLVADGPMLDRWAEHLTKGAKKYARRNWMKAQGLEELERAKSSAFRHLRQWLRGDADEDHAAAVFFNVNEAEYIKSKSIGG